MIFDKSINYFGFIFLCFLFLSSTETSENGATATRLTKGMIENTKQIKTLSYTMKKVERIKSRLVTQVSDVRLVRSPYKVYTKQKFPKEGLEALYIEGENHNKAIINPNRFPWINLKLDPFGKIMRKDQHHTILDSGYDLVISIIEHIQNKYGEASNGMLENIGEAVWDGHKCWTIKFSNPDFSFIPYKVKENETLLTIAKKLKLSEYMILQNNKAIHDYTDISKGQTIFIPNDYCESMVVFIDQARNIPLQFKIYDHKGLFEQYEFTNIDVNFNLKSGEFTEAYAGYGF